MYYQTTQQKINDLAINPLGDYNQIVEEIQSSEFYQSSNWYIQRLLTSPESIDTLQLAYKLGREEVYHILNFKLGKKPSEAIQNNLEFLALSEGNQSAVLNYADACIKRAKYELYPEAYGAGEPKLPTIKLPIPFNTDGNIESPTPFNTDGNTDQIITISLDRYMGCELGL